MWVTLYLSFRLCQYFPEEFSILVTLRMSTKSMNGEHWLFALMNRAGKHTKLGLALYNAKLHFHYLDKLTKKRRVAEFKNLNIFDKAWHTFVLSVTGSRAALKVDCGKYSSRMIRRSFPALLNTLDTNFHVGNCNNKRTQFPVSCFIGWREERSFISP